MKTTLLPNGRRIGASVTLYSPFTPTIESIFDAPQANPLPDTFIPYIYDQYEITDCGPETVESDVNELNPGFVGSPKFIAKETRLLDKFGPEDGTDFPHLAQALLNSGSCPISMMPDNAGSDTAEDYWSPNGITEAIAEAALPQRIKGWGQLQRTPTWAELQQILALRNSADIIIALGNRFYEDANGNGSYNPAVLFPLQFGTFVSYHWIKIISAPVAQLYGIANPNPDYIYFKNSWGTSYGAKGIGWFDASYIQYIQEVDVVY